MSESLKLKAGGTSGDMWASSLLSLLGGQGNPSPPSWELVVGAEAGPEVLFPVYDSPGKTPGTCSISGALLPPNGVTAPASLG